MVQVLDSCQSSANFMVCTERLVPNVIVVRFTKTDSFGFEGWAGELLALLRTAS